MSATVRHVPAENVRALRLERFARADYQFICYSWHERGWTDSYLLEVDGHTVGYGLVGGVSGNPRDEIVEFDCSPSHQAAALTLFRRMISLSGAKTIRTQTNDTLLTLMLLDCAVTIEAEAALFRDSLATNLRVDGAVFRATDARERGHIFEHTTEPVGDWLIEAAGEVVATGGVLYHYNRPFGDIFMEVAAPHRRRGYGSLLVQELKRECAAAAATPAARCNAANEASRATLQRAGMLPCARVLRGEIEATVAV